MNVEIPYTTTVRPDTGVTNPTLGFWLFLASEVMLFASLFSSYVLLRSGAASWPDQSAFLSLPLGGLNTAILFFATVAIDRARRALIAAEPRRFRLLMAASLALGAAFIAIKAVEYGDKLAMGLGPATSNFLGLYFTMTGVHALHVLAGLAVNAFLWGPGLAMWHTEPARFTQRVRLAGLYWTFVDLVWIALFVVFYLS